MASVISAISLACWELLLELKFSLLAMRNVFHEAVVADKALLLVVGADHHERFVEGGAVGSQSFYF